jgi:hypothetical protein
VWVASGATGSRAAGQQHAGGYRPSNFWRNQSAFPTTQYEPHGVAGARGLSRSQT